MQKLLPDTSKGIFASVINEESTDAVLLMTVFDWVSSHSKLYINRNVRIREGIIDCINEMFLDRLTTINYVAKLIVNSLAQAQINWHSLKILTELHDRSKDDLESYCFLFLISILNFSMTRISFTVELVEIQIKT